MNTSLQILLSIAVIILVAKLAGALSARVGLPLILGELLAGVLLGPTVFDIWSINWLARSSLSGERYSVVNVFKVLAELGVVMLMFMAGLETDAEMMHTLRLLLLFGPPPVCGSSDVRRDGSRPRVPL